MKRGQPRTDFCHSLKGFIWMPTRGGTRVRRSTYARRRRSDGSITEIRFFKEADRTRGTKANYRPVIISYGL